MSTPAGDHQFQTTLWSLVRIAKTDDASRTRARSALERLCQTYWYPLYAFVRSRGYSATDAQDLTQEFFHHMLRGGGFSGASPEKGRFRSYLLGAMKHFLTNEWRKKTTRKRGGDYQLLEWDTLSPESRYERETASSGSSEQRFDRAWAMQTVHSALQALETEMTKAGKAAHFHILEGTLTGGGTGSREDLARELGTSVDTLKVTIHRLRARYRQLIREAVLETVDNPTDLESEIRYLIEVLKTPAS